MQRMTARDDAPCSTCDSFLVLSTPHAMVGVLSSGNGKSQNARWGRGTEMVVVCLFAGDDVKRMEGEARATIVKRRVVRAIVVIQFSEMGHLLDHTRPSPEVNFGVMGHFQKHEWKVASKFVGKIKNNSFLVGMRPPKLKEN